jgi:hypothetical protein
MAGSVVTSRFVILFNICACLKICASNLPLRKVAKRYGQGYETPQRNTSDKRTTLKVEAKTLCGDQRPK